jgi:hypothetical protein
MIEAKEHFYADDPSVGPADVRTMLAKVEYFFLGNGLIQAAVQWSPDGEGTPLGLLVMDPERLAKKRESLTMDPVHGLGRTMVEVLAGELVLRPGGGSLDVSWMKRNGLPTVRASWGDEIVKVEERFFVPDRGRALLVREVAVRNAGGARLGLRLRTGVPGSEVEWPVVLDPGETKSVLLGYALNAVARRMDIGVMTEEAAQPAVAPFRPAALAEAEFGHPLLDHYFSASRDQLPAAVSRSGRLDGSIWQYNREWPRDQAVIAAALAMIGEREIARTMLDRLLTEFISDEGDAIDSSEKREPAEVELDQNGFLLHALRQYVHWTGDVDLVREKWPKVVAAAEFPLRAVFRHGPSGLLTNRREFWERHRIHGIEPGLELAHQLYVSVGLSAAASLARLTGKADRAAAWEGEAARLRKAMLEDRTYRLADNRGFIKRRGLDGRVQETIAALPEANLPAAVPLAAAGSHDLNPDTSAALPIVLEFVPGDSPLATLTLSSLETLWDQAWTGGGYGRYHFTSEADSAGAWPFPSLFVARAAVEAGDPARAWRVLEWLGRVPGARAGAWPEFYGPRIAPPFPQVGIIPWTWAEMIHLLVHHVLGIRPEEGGLRWRPRPLPGLGRIRACFAVRENRVEIDLDLAAIAAGGGGDGRFLFSADGPVARSSAREAFLPWSGRDVRLTARSVPRS